MLEQISSTGYPFKVPLGRRRFLKASAAALGGLSLSSCGWTLAEVRQSPASAKTATDTLYIYTWSSYIDRTLLDEFTAQTGFKVVADVFDSDDTMLATVQAGKGAAYSVIYPSAYGVEKMIDLKLLSVLDHSQIQGLENLLPQFQNSFYDPGNRHSIPISWGTTGLIYNSKKLNLAPDDWGYLWQNRQKIARRFTMLNDVREVMGATLRSLGYSYNSQNPAEIEKAFQKLMELKPSIAAFTTDAWKTQIIPGDLWVAMAYSSDAVAAMKENSDLRYVIPRSGSSLWNDTVVIPKAAPNLAAAYAWINFIMQPAVASQLCQRLFFATPNRAAYDQLPAPIRDNPSLFPEEAVLKNCERIAPVGKLSEVYDKYWTRLTSS